MVGGAGIRENLLRKFDGMDWILRIAVAGEFIGHGVFGLQAKQSWIPYLTSVGVSTDTAVILLPLIGALDITLGILVLIRPFRIALLWMTFWAFATALIRPIAGEPIWDFVERFANIGAPMALLYLRGIPR
ncbi:hypothetical protein A3D84_06055 [Candidatus Woesebacteria bacterium RIFCSPHIGHO2_02_FULL_42_20]|uniref:DoxX family protein n=1 Tax=Candidatus Woesebacteria bacterium RIFCSPHIGHO2_12_FULL_41_24 TaxID=1802510 RepID=A0A1F8ASC1_9BACT|nr:MAG: hypothetical protein A2W15_01005 [Candidatus Woesebacteria bacterium RBG_16_41_13]OGM28765.1 MAG: hypothetical protein A2873_01710 [Candidatus Woesebacteria bacterium RIFCSPHIGHO2_01_FULL_42_80]OGM34965.1 MAG: hypothetical protein A3D84_06055 [Candidatus Woesebacteria bacterium RIFCSPHIGHO2_02_FULL_42_20]OGM54656.1 MAG: hypothetical protein A3E44_02415 [Candidatus Woesebacteria bacterium RIFCSPHIGHO2_12_FULL_41_24]OGM67281.1 MAG: hypothetical protein A2969_04455 [Candidatus Woesebacteri